MSEATAKYVLSMSIKPKHENPLKQKVENNGENMPQPTLYCNNKAHESLQP